MEKIESTREVFYSVLSEIRRRYKLESVEKKCANFITEKLMVDVEEEWRSCMMGAMEGQYM